MSRQIDVVKSGELAVLTCTEKSDGCGWSPVMRAELSRALNTVFADDTITLVVLRGGIAGWPNASPDPAGDFIPHHAAPQLSDLAHRIRGAQKPVVALLAGEIIGGSFALAQAASWRIADPSTRFHCLETSLNSLPAGGGLTLLARRSGAGPALAYALGTRPIGARDGLALGLIEEVERIDGDDAAGLRAALRGRPLRAEPTRALSDRITYLAALEEARATIGTGGGAAIDPRVAHRIVDVVEAALLLPERGSMEFEAVAFEDLIETPSARALRYQARARRSASELGAPDSCAPDLGASDSGAPDGAASPPDNTGSRDVERGAAPVIDVGLWLPADVDIATGGDDRGEGAEGSGIGAERRLTSLGRLAWRLALGGASIRLGAGSQTDLEDLLSVVARAQAQEVSRKSVTEQEGEAAWSRITPVVREVDLAGADWIVSAEPPKGAAGDKCLSRLARVGGDTPRFVLLGGENTQPRETEDGRLAQGWQGLRLGAHIVEITAIDPVAISALRAARFTPVYVAAPHMGGGTIAQRLQAAYILAGERLAIAGADIARIDTVLRKAGFGDGPFRRLDKAGPAARRALFRAAGRTEGILIREWSGAFYAPQTPDRAPNASTDAMTRPAQAGASTRLAPGVGEALDLLREQRPALRLTDGQIIARVVAELADEAVLMLRIGAVNRPSDVDLIMALDCGMRADMGGPMHMADAIGLLTMRNQLRALTGEGARAPDPLWDVLIKNGRKFSDLNGSACGG